MLDQNADNLKQLAWHTRSKHRLVEVQYTQVVLTHDPTNDVSYPFT
jgi:hypothetical protein